MSKFRLNYEKDKLIDLVVRYCQAFFTFRLRNCVIRAGLRLVSLAYSRISLGDIALKLHINSEKEVITTPLNSSWNFLLFRQYPMAY